MYPDSLSRAVPKTPFGPLLLFRPLNRPSLPRPQSWEPVQLYVPSVVSARPFFSVPVHQAGSHKLLKGATLSPHRCSGWPSQAVFFRFQFVPWHVILVAERLSSPCPSFAPLFTLKLADPSASALCAQGVSLSLLTEDSGLFTRSAQPLPPSSAKTFLGMPPIGTRCGTGIIINHHTQGQSYSCTQFPSGRVLPRQSSRRVRGGKEPHDY